MENKQKGVFKSKMTPLQRIQKYPGKFYQKNGNLLCIVCAKIVNLKKSTIDNHLKNHTQI